MPVTEYDPTPVSASTNACKFDERIPSLAPAEFVARNDMAADSDVVRFVVAVLMAAIVSLAVMFSFTFSVKLLVPAWLV